MRLFIRILTILLIAVIASPLLAQSGKTIDKRRDAAKRGTKYTLQSSRGDAVFTIKNIDITHFPEMGIIFSAVDSRNQFIRTLRKEDIAIQENGIDRPIVSLDLVSGENRVPIDIVFVIDQTASMTDMIGTVKENVDRFAEELVRHGFDYRLGMVRFSDIVEWVSPNLTDDVNEFE